MRKVDGWQTLAENTTFRSLTSPHDRIASCRPKMRQSTPTQVATGSRRVPIRPVRIFPPEAVKPFILPNVHEAAPKIGVI